MLCNRGDTAAVEPAAVDAASVLSNRIADLVLNRAGGSADQSYLSSRSCSLMAMILSIAESTRAAAAVAAVAGAGMRLPGAA